MLFSPGLIYVCVCVGGKPVGHDLGESLGLQQQVDVWDDFGPAENTLQTVGLQHAVQLRQQVGHYVDKPNIDTQVCAHTQTHIILSQIKINFICHVNRIQQL